MVNKKMAIQHQTKDRIRRKKKRTIGEYEQQLIQLLPVLPLHQDLQDFLFLLSATPDTRYPLVAEIDPYQDRV